MTDGGALQVAIYTLFFLTFPQLSDVGCAVHLCTLLHQRYGEFSEMLLDKLQQFYQTPITKDDEKVCRIMEKTYENTFKTNYA